MKKKIIILSALICSNFAFSQVGVNTADPKATFDINAKNATGRYSTPEGLLVPRVDRQRAQFMTNVETSTLIYVDSIATGDQAGNAINIDKAGYYYFDGSFWVKLNTNGNSLDSVNIYNSDGTLSTSRVLNQGDKNLSFSGTTGYFAVNGNNDGLTRNYFRNLNTGANSRSDINVGSGASNIYLGTDNSSAIFGAGPKAYIDNRTGGRFVIGDNGAARLTIDTSGNIGIGTATPNALLQFRNNVNNRKIVMYETANNDHQFFGFGINSYMLRYQTDTTLSDHVFFAGANATTSNELMRIKGNGNVGIGTSAPNGNAILDLTANNKGFLPPRLTTAQRDTMVTRPAGLMIYNVNTNCMDFWNSSVWVSTCAVTAPPAGSITDITCTSATNNGTITTGSNNSVTSVIPYTGGNGGSHGGQTVTSTGVTGLTATLAAGSFANGAGSLTYTITGTPSAVGTANFTINIGGRTCSLSRTVTLPVGAIASLNCTAATNNGTLTGGTAASGVSSLISYTGGNTGTHGGQVVTSTGVTGLTAVLTAGAFANGNGSLTYTITGTPAASGTASFAINIGGRTCTLTRTVTAAVTPPVSPSINCTTASFLIPYTANGGTVNGTINGIPVTATITSTNMTQGPAISNCFGITQNTTFRATGASQSSLTIKFNRKVSNARVYDTFTGGSSGSNIIYRNNGVIVTPAGTVQYANCGYGTNTTVARPAGGVWYDEITIGVTGSNIEMICVGSVQ